MNLSCSTHARKRCWTSYSLIPFLTCYVKSCVMENTFQLLGRGNDLLLNCQKSLPRGWDGRQPSVGAKVEFARTFPSAFFLSSVSKTSPTCYPLYKPTWFLVWTEPILKKPGINLIRHSWCFPACWCAANEMLLPKVMKSICFLPGKKDRGLLLFVWRWVWQACLPS